MGSKNGYKIAVLGAMGLRCGLGADAVLLNDAGPWAHIYATLADPANCAEVAKILRGWADEEPRELWERLREEHRGEWDGWGAERAAGWIVVEGWSYAQGSDTPKLNDVKAYGGEASGHPEYAWKPQTTGKFASRVESVAAWLQCNAWSAKGKGVDAGYRAPYDTAGVCRSVTPDMLHRRVTPIAAPLSVYAGPAEDLAPPDDCEGVYMLCDPPYHGANGTEKITGYAHDLPRADLLVLLRRWSDAGAVVCCCESVPFAGELGSGWYSVDIAHARVGQKRTFARVTSEFITLNRAPAEVPAVQSEMFG